MLRHLPDIECHRKECALLVREFVDVVSLVGSEAVSCVVIVSDSFCSEVSK